MNERAERRPWRSQPAAWALSPFAICGAAGLGLIGGVVGLIVGLRSYASTAWFAVLEVGLPCGLLGGLLGAVSGVLALNTRSVRVGDLRRLHRRD